MSYPAKGNESHADYKEDFFAAFVYNDSLSASLASNSAYAARGTAGDQCYPVRAQFDAKDGGSSVAIGLGSTLWYYTMMVPLRYFQERRRRPQGADG